MLSKQNGSGITESSLKILLSNSYAKSKNQKKSIDGYKREKSLSGQRATVYYNPVTGDAIVTHKGAASIQD